MYFVNEDKSIYVTRGDALPLAVSGDNNGVPYLFHPGEVIRFRVFEKKGCHCTVLQKDTVIVGDEAMESVDIVLTKNETRIGDLISKPKDYWYEVELNPDSNPQTIVGYDDDGPKIFRLFPEGADTEGGEGETPDDFVPGIDDELDAESERPVQNKAITNKISEIETTAYTASTQAGQARIEVTQVHNAVAEMGGSVQQMSERLNVIENDKITQMEKDIADLKYEPIEITDIKTSRPGGVAEMGSTVPSVAVYWETNKAPVSIKVNGESVDATAESITFNTPITTNKTYTVVVTDERGATATASTGINFYNGVYYGVGTADTAIGTLTKKLQSGKGLTFTANAGNGQNILYALPTRYGTPSFNVGGFDGGFSKAATINFTNASGYTESYDLWVSDNTGLGNTTVKVS